MTVFIPAGRFDRDVLLDPRAPFLDHHRPGGKALLGTVGALETMAAEISRLTGNATIGGLRNVQAIKPVIFESEDIRKVHVSIDHGEEDGIFFCRLTSQVGPGRLDHAECSMTLPLHPAMAAMRPPCFTGAALPGEAVYRAFFHGPAFQVVHRVEWRGASMLAECAPCLSAWTLNCKTATAIAPRLIEFAMQTGGLLNLARTGRMLIPRSILRIDRYTDIDVNSGISLYAVATPSEDTADHALDIDIVDGEGTRHLSLAGYRSMPLPYESDDSAVSLLRDQLIGKFD